MGAFAGRAAWGLLIAILVWAPLPYASVIPWAYHLLAVLAALALALALWDRRRPLRLPWELVAAIAAFLLAVGWGLSCRARPSRSCSRSRTRCGRNSRRRGSRSSRPSPSRPKGAATMPCGC